MEVLIGLKLYIQHFHSVYSKVFYIADYNHHCFTPSIHTVLHLPYIFEYFGDLLDVSHFLPERILL